MMDEMITAYYVAYTVFLCLSSIQVVVDLVKDWHKHVVPCAKSAAREIKTRTSVIPRDSLVLH